MVFPRFFLKLAPHGWRVSSFPSRSSHRGNATKFFFGLLSIFLLIIKDHRRVATDEALAMVRANAQKDFADLAVVGGLNVSEAVFIWDRAFRQS